MSQGMFGALMVTEALEDFTCPPWLLLWAVSQVQDDPPGPSSAPGWGFSWDLCEIQSLCETPPTCVTTGRIPAAHLLFIYSVALSPYR